MICTITGQWGQLTLRPCGLSVVHQIQSQEVETVVLKLVFTALRTLRPYCTCLSAYMTLHPRRPCPDILYRENLVCHKFVCYQYRICRVVTTLSHEDQNVYLSCIHICLIVLIVGILLFYKLLEESCFADLFCKLSHMWMVPYIACRHTHSLILRPSTWGFVVCSSTILRLVSDQARALAQ